MGQREWVADFCRGIKRRRKEGKSHLHAMDQSAAVPLRLRFPSLFPPAASLGAAKTCCERLDTPRGASGQPQGAGSSTPGFNYSKCLPNVADTVPLLGEVWSFCLAFCFNLFPDTLGVPQTTPLLKAWNCPRLCRESLCKVTRRRRFFFFFFKLYLPEVIKS